MSHLILVKLPIRNKNLTLSIQLNTPVAKVILLVYFYTPLVHLPDSYLLLLVPIISLDYLLYSGTLLYINCPI